MCHRQHTHTTQHFTMRLREKNKRQRCRSVSATAADVAAFIFADLPDIDDVDVIWCRRTVGVQFPSYGGEIRATTTDRNVTQWRCAVDRCVTSQRVWSRIDINTFFQLSCPRSKTHKTQLKHDCTSSFFSKRLLYLKYTPKKSHDVRSNHSSLHVTWFTQECACFCTQIVCSTYTSPSTICTSSYSVANNGNICMHERSAANRHQ